jgi:hypothetical protein
MGWRRGIFYRENRISFIHPLRFAFSHLIGVIVVFCETLNWPSFSLYSYCATQRQQKRQSAIAPSHTR